MLRIETLPEGRQVRLLRVAAGLTLFDVGARANVPPARLSEFERGQRSLPPDAVERVRSVVDAEAAKRAEANHAIA